MDLRLKGKNAIVMGGTRGIGRAIVETLGNEGCAVAFCARNPEQVTQAVDSLKSRGISAYGGVLDITNGNALQQWVDQVSDQMGGLNILVSSAGALAQGVDEAAWMRNLQLDILGTANAIEAALPFLEVSAQQSGDAAIVAIGSGSSINATTPSSYGAIKAALVHYIKGIAKQNAPKHIRANVVSPGMVYFEGGFWNQMEQKSPALFKSSLARNPMGRMATVQEVANAAVFLTSPCSSFTSGANLIVDGALSDRVNY